MHAVSGGWGIEMGHLKIVVKIPDTIYPELVADLDRVQLRDRAERIRLLAMLGLRAVTQSAPHDSAKSSDPGPSQERESSTNRLIKNLSDSL